MNKLPLISLLCPLLGSAAVTKPNVMILFLDDVSAQDFGCYGVRDPQVANTPTIDRLAGQGSLFLQCWGTPLCEPSRAMMMTGRYAPRTQWWDNEMKPEGGEQDANFAEGNLVANRIFHDNGYATAFLGKWQIGGGLSDPAYGIDYGLTSGWGVGKNPYPHREWPDISPMPGQGDWEFNPSMYQWDAETGEQGYIPTKAEDYGADLELVAVKNFIKKQAQKKKPFFVYWPTHVGHGGWDYRRTKPAGWSHTPVPLKDENGKQLFNADGTLKLSQATYKAHVEYADYLMREILKFLDQEKLAENTIVVFAADNGAKYFGKGSVLQQRGTHVPLIIRAPGLGAAKSSALVSLVDVTPTLVDLAGLDVSKDYAFDGKSLKPIMSGEKETVRDFVVSYLNVKNMVRNDRYILDGWGTLWDTHGSLDHAKFTDVSGNPELGPLKEQLKKFADQMLPLPSENQPFYRRFLMKKDKVFELMKKIDKQLLDGTYFKKYDVPEVKDETGRQIMKISDK